MTTNVNQNAISTLQNINTAINTLNQTVAKVFPLASSSVTGSAGSATGTYLTIDINGVSYKLALLAP